MGFCIFNNIGVPGLMLWRKSLERVASSISMYITATVPRTCFSPPHWHKRVLMASFFQHPFYPYSGTSIPHRT